MSILACHKSAGLKKILGDFCRKCSMSEEGLLSPSSSSSKFDVFLSYNRKDAEAVETIARSLVEQDLQVWFDRWELMPGAPWRKLVQEALSRVPSTAVFIGPDGYGAWEEVEFDAALEEQVRRNCRLIPVLLPGVPEDIKLPPFLQRNTWVNFHSGLNDPDAIYRLCWGIRGVKPAEAPPPSSPKGARVPRDPVHQAAGKLVTVLTSGNVTYFVGSGTFSGVTGLPPSTYEVSKELLSSLLLSLDVPAEEDAWVLPLDLVGSYFEIKEGDLSLENKVVDLIRDRSRGVPATHLQLARLLRMLQKRPRRRIRVRTRQLVVTTNLDLMMERALLQEGLSFTRIVQDRSAPRIIVNRYDVALDGDRIVFGDGRRVRCNDFDELDEQICMYGLELVDFPAGQRSAIGQNPLRVLPLHGSLDDDGETKEIKGPILYKPQGFLDVARSCAISLEQYFDFLIDTMHNIPKEVRDLVENCPILFLGYSFLDPEFRLIYHTLLRGRIQASNRLFSCQLRPNDTRRLEASLWEELKNAGMSRGVATIEERGDVFLELLCQLLRRELEKEG